MFFFVFFLLLLLAGLASLITQNNLLTSLLVFLPALALKGFNVFDAYHVTENYNLSHNLESSFRKKQPFLALFLSFFLNGLGQFYNRQFIKGIIFLIVSHWLSSSLGGDDEMGKIGLEAMLRIGCMLDSYESAKKINAHDLGDLRSNQTRQFRKQLLLFCGLFFLNIILMFALRYLFVASYEIPTASMSPTLRAGDRVFVDQFSYRAKPPKRGDIVAFEHPLYRKKVFLKRIVGLPGERLQIKNGRVYINEQLLSYPAFFKYHYYTNREDWLYGKENQRLEIPAGAYFVLGDNTKQSSDSRDWGVVHVKLVKGKVSQVWWPLNRWNGLDQFDLGVQ